MSGREPRPFAHSLVAAARSPTVWVTRSGARHFAIILHLLLSAMLRHWHHQQRTIARSNQRRVLGVVGAQSNNVVALVQWHAGPPEYLSVLVTGARPVDRQRDGPLVPIGGVQPVSQVLQLPAAESNDAQLSIPSVTPQQLAAAGFTEPMLFDGPHTSRVLVVPISAEVAPVSVTIGQYLSIDGSAWRSGGPQSPRRVSHDAGSCLWCCSSRGAHSRLRSVAAFRVHRRAAGHSMRFRAGCGLLCAAYGAAQAPAPSGQLGASARQRPLRLLPRRRPLLLPRLRVVPPPPRRQPRRPPLRQLHFIRLAQPSTTMWLASRTSHRARTPPIAPSRDGCPWVCGASGQRMRIRTTKRPSLWPPAAKIRSPRLRRG